MRFFKLFTISLCLLLVGLVVAQEEKPTQDKPQAATSEIVVYPASNSPASHLAAILPGVLEDDSVRVTADPMGNLLLIRAGADSRDKVLSLLKALDRPQRTVIVDAYLLKLKGEPLSDEEAAALSGPSDAVAEKITALQADERLVVANHIELAALENQPSILQVGEQVAVAAGVTSVGSGRRMINYKDHRVGTMLKVEARTTPADAIVLNMDFERSGLEAADEPKDDEDAEAQTPRSLTTLTHQTTLSLPNGHARLSGALSGGTASDSRHAYLVVSARIAKDSEKQRVASAKSFSRSLSGGSGGRPGAETSRSRRSPPIALDARYLAYFTKMLQKYDLDKDGKLNAEEWGRMSKDPSKADTNKDGFVTAEELAVWGRKK